MNVAYVATARLPVLMRAVTQQFGGSNEQVERSVQREVGESHHPDRGRAEALEWNVEQTTPQGYHRAQGCRIFKQLTPAA